MDSFINRGDKVSFTYTDGQVRQGEAESYKRNSKGEMVLTIRKTDGSFRSYKRALMGSLVNLSRVPN